MDLSERKLKILQAIIADFIRTAEPVGSRTLSRNYDLGISPATIRNEMSDLEEMGYLTHPHTSSGRVPSEKAYRLYVNEMMPRTELSAAAKDAIAMQLHSNVNELENIVQRAAHVLSEITSLTAFAMTPKKDQDLSLIHILIDVAVHSAVGQQTEQVQCRAVFLHVIDSLEKRLVFKERAILDRLRYHRKILIYYASGSDIEMADFRVAHLAFGKPDVQSAGFQRC